VRIQRGLLLLPVGERKLPGLVSTTLVGDYSVEKDVSRADWQKEDGDVELWFVDVISRWLFVIFLRGFFFEFGDYEWSDRLNQGLHATLGDTTNWRGAH
jgi:hypothetical protein